MRLLEKYYTKALNHSFVKEQLANLKAYDTYTYEHSLSVAKDSLELGCYMKLNNEEMENLSYASLLHDIGKIKIDRRIIQKEDVLTDKEMRLIRLHPLYGAELIKPATTFHVDVRTGILMHHENYNGTGYITKFCGNEIPLIARIIRITDSYDAMQDSRPYQKHREKEDIFRSLKNESGISYDPAILEIFFHIKSKNF